MSMKIELLACLMLAACTVTSGFFLSWGSPQPVKSQLPQPQPLQSPHYPTLAYYQRVMQAQAQQQAQYVDGNGVPMQPLQPIPAIPIQVPLQAQFAPAPAVQNVQLVPCLCPVSQDMEYVENAAFPTSPAKPTQATQYQPSPHVQQMQQKQSP